MIFLKSLKYYEMLLNMMLPAPQAEWIEREKEDCLVTV